ncbi:MAG: HD domain-containing protein [Desulfobacteraceae bacterium]|nr:HD domain-containing protein [Desulfobacteraceae bacterium]
MRVLLYYGYAFLVLFLYGGQVCPFIESLTLFEWGGLLLAVMAVQSVARVRLVRRLVSDSPYEVQASRQFWAEFLAFFASGLLIAGFNLASYHFPLGSGFKVLLGFSLMGFFTAADLAMERERLILKETERGGRPIPMPERIFPLTRKITVVASILVVATSTVIFLLVVKDLDWLMQLDAGNRIRAVWVILGEVAFVLVVILLPTIFLIRSFSRNLRIFLSSENDALLRVSQGRLDQYVTVATSDEFGLMAHYTNRMIDGLKRLNEELEQAQDATICSLASLAETRSSETGEHIRRTQHYVLALAERLRQLDGIDQDLDDEAIRLLFKCAPLHDIGKVGVADRILLKPGPLDPREWEEMKRHTLYGRDVLRRAEESIGSESPFLRVAGQIAYTHHEKWDGSGYPQGLRGRQTPLCGRIMAVADVYDALISSRVYKAPLSHDEACAIIVEGKNLQFDPAVIEAFTAVQDRFREISLQFGNNGETPTR